MKTKKLLVKRKVGKDESKEEPKKRPIKKKKVPKKEINSSFVSFKDSLTVVSVYDDLPPDTTQNVIYFDKNYGWELGRACTVREHIIHDHSHGYGMRTVLWALIPEVKTVED